MIEIAKKSTAIVTFGDFSPLTGTRPGMLFQVTIDPAKISPSGEYIRFGEPGDEIVGWQRCAALTVVEVLLEWEDGVDAKDQVAPFGSQGKVTMMEAH